ncbi:hypothetical protein JCM8115_003515 [Rhodotorula mucilaginosa]
MASSSSSVLGVVAAAAAAAPSRSEPKPLIRASKEWVVPPRPKPGRKSAKAGSDTAKPTAKTTQKAFRERRQEYVTELEEKVRRLEAGEGEKCVFYQQQAQRAKSEALAWQQENAKLRQEVEALRAELARQSSPPSLSSGSGARTSRARPAPTTEFADSAAAAPPPPKRRRRAPSNASSSSRATPTFAGAEESCSPPLAPHRPPTHFSPLSDDPPQPSASTSPGAEAMTTRIQIPRCTFCSTGPDCFCAQVGFDIVQTPAATSHSGSSASSSSASTQQVDRLPAADEDPYAAETTYEPAVPLKLRRSGTGSQKSKKPSVWAIEAPAVTGAARLIDAAKAVCSGDPSNCPACSDDPFGKAFCNALSSSVCSTQPCANCPSNRSGRRIPTPPPEKPSPAPSMPMPIIDEGMALLESLTDLPCCGDPILCGSKTCKTEDQAEPIPPPPLPSLEADTAASAGAGVETVPCNEAWSALKQHPNIAFADLQMLAEVVAKRTYCKGAVTETPPPPAGVVSETFPAAATGRAPLIKFSQAFAVENTRRRLTVERGAVNEALGILDRAVIPPPPGPSPLYRG